MESPEEISRPLSKRIQLLVACWLAASAALMLALWSYEVRAGEVASVRSRIPDDYSTVSSDPSLNGQLFVFVHPKCGCTVATLEELEHLLAELPALRRPAVRIVVLQPSATGLSPLAGQRWECTQAETLSQQFDQAALLSDEGGRSPVCSVRGHQDKSSCMGSMVRSCLTVESLCHEGTGVRRRAGTPAELSPERRKSGSNDTSFWVCTEYSGITFLNPGSLRGRKSCAGV